MASGVAARRPASTGRVTPETQRASSEARNRAAKATSQAVPSKTQGAGPPAQGQHFLGSVGGPPWGCGTWPGAMQFTRTLSRP